MSSIIAAFFLILLSNSMVDVRPINNAPHSRPELIDPNAVPTPIHYMEGENAFLPCPVRPMAGLEFEWRRRDNNKMIENSDRYRINSLGVLKIITAVLNDTAEYVCKAYNDFGKVWAKPQRLQIVAKSAFRSPFSDHQFDAGLKFKHVYGEEQVVDKHLATEVSVGFRSPAGGSVRMNCDGHRVNWYKNGEFLRRKRLPPGSVKDRNGTLVLANLRFEDTGNYSCVHKLTLASKSFELIVSDDYMIGRSTSEPESQWSSKFAQIFWASFAGLTILVTGVSVILCLKNRLMRDNSKNDEPVKVDTTLDDSSPKDTPPPKPRWKSRPKDRSHHLSR